MICQRAFDRARHKRAVVNRYKRMKGCIDCGYKSHHHALQFDHIDETTKEKTVASMMYAGWARIKAEITKCVVRCCNCHAIRTNTRHFRKI